jgi:uncharacterized protein (TIGR03000 family)
MRKSHPTPAVALSALLTVALFATPGQVHGQLMSTWGHPVFTFGSTPYDSTNAGHGNYPGGPGFIPGYGYYPGQGPGHYPWMDGPGTPFDRRLLWGEVPGAPPAAEPVPPPADVPLPAGAALVSVRIPAEAELWFDDAKTSQTGSYRQFATPPLPAGRELVYTLRARWRLRDVELHRVEVVRVQPGARVTVDFLTTDSWTGYRVGDTAARGK